MDRLLISVEAGLYIVAIVVALMLRFANLGYWPLLSAEVTEAWPAWSFLHGGRLESFNYSPLLFGVNLFNFMAFGASDAMARLLPALAGTVIVILPYLLRDRLGRCGAIAASLLLALSPSFVYFSRTVSGTVLVAASVLIFLVAAHRYVTTRQKGHIYLGGIALALGLMSAATIYTVLVAGLIFGGYLWLRNRRHLGDVELQQLQVAWQDLKAGKEWRAALGLGVALIVLISTVLLWHWSGLQATLNLLGRWLHNLTTPDGITRWSYYLRALLVYETLPLFVGLAGIVLALRRGAFLGIFATIWFIVALVLGSVAGTRPAELMPIIVLPLILLAAQAADALISTTPWVEIDSANVLFVIIFVVLSSFIYLQLTAFTVQGETAYLRLAVVSIGILLLSFAIFWYWAGTAQALPIAAATLLAILLATTIHSTMELNAYNARDPRELLAQQAVSIDLRHLRPFLIDLSERTSERERMPIMIERALHPLLSWYTRDFGPVRLVNAVPPAPQERVVITLAQGAAEGPAGFVGQRFRVWTTVETAHLGWGDWLKWYLHRFKIGTETSQQIEVWFRP